ncbi:hypothetical protein FRB94_010161 [Tulasnella sp. JGI-2019a]|nr:hypothetical protein FRB94_010161 [Tulasnella sp. JGI-2019a]
MSKMEEFEKLLKSAVASSRLSQSKMESLVKLAMKTMENDTQMISILYRTHKTLPATSKIPSLYIFDSLARAARSHATKHRADAGSSTGNAATFLTKMEGILDGLIQDMLAIGTTEAKEKTVKILDIWTKANTFPPTVMTRLVGLTQSSASGVQPVTVDTSNTLAVASSSTPSTGENSQAPTPVVDPRRPTHKPTVDASADAAVVPSTQPNVDATALLALLAQAQGASSNTNPTPIAASNSAGTAGAALPGLDPTQIALLQQIAGQLPGGAQQQQPVAQSHGWPSGGAPSAVGSGFDAYNGRGDTSTYSERDHRQYDRPHTDRVANGGQHDRGGYSDNCGGDFPSRGSFGERGRWNDGRRGNGRREWDDHDGSRRRSRSPPPPRNNRFGAPSNFSPTQNGNGSISPRAAVTGQNLSVIPVHDSSTHHVSNNTQNPISPVEAVGSVPLGGLASFDLSTFDPTSPDSWTKLGEAWKVTNGRYPTQEELMMFIATGGVTPSATSNIPITNPGQDMNGGDQMSHMPQNQWGADPSMESYGGSGGRGFGGQRGFQRGRGRGGFADRGGGGNRGGFTPGFNSQPMWNGNTVDPSLNHHSVRNGAGAFNGPNSNTHTNTMMRQPGNGPTSIVDAVIADAQKGISSESDDQTRPKAAGKMIKVGDRWKWVKGGE